MQLRTRTPVPPKRRGEAGILRIADDVDRLLRAKPFQADEAGRFRIGDVYLVQTANADGTITVSLQNALTDGPLVSLGDLA